VLRRLLVPDDPPWPVPSGPAERPPPITTLGVVTRNRLDALTRAVQSYAANAQRHARPVDVVVMDDSEAPATRAQARDVLTRLAGESGWSIHYGGLDEKRAFARDLGEAAGVPPGLVDFALFGVPECDRTYGANRNALLLHTAGELIVSVDDDTICRMAPVPASTGGLAFSSADDPGQLRVFANREAAFAAVEFVDRDFLTRSAHLLGQDVPGLAAACAGAPDVEDTSPAFLRRLRRGAGRVVATMLGFVGDQGTGSPQPLLGLTGAERQSLVASADTYRAAMEGGYALRGARRPTVGDSGRFASMVFGLDNRWVLAPFFPAARGSDTIHGRTVHACFEDACWGFLPWVAVHAPLSPRSFPPGQALADIARSRTAQMVLACVDAAGVSRERVGGTRSLAALGRHLAALGALPFPDFVEFLRAARWRFASGRIRHLEALLDTHGGTPDYWARDATAAVAALREAVVRPEYLVPADLAAGRDPEAAQRLCQRLVLEYGRLVQAWPALVAAARSLRAQGRRLARPL
jgi:hypothetical protein